MSLDHYSTILSLGSIAIFAAIFLISVFSFFSEKVNQKLEDFGYFNYIYVILLIYGWIRWNSKKEENPDFVPENMSPDQWKKSLLVFLAGSCLFGYLFQNFTDASLPWLDSTLTTASLIAQWMVAKKKIENWIIWIFANSVYIPLFFFKHLPFTALLYFLFLIMAISGYLQWKKLKPANQS